MIVIKPHHFMDIVKLYGAGIETFVPDERFHHDFYKAANAITGNLDERLKMTVNGDDICRPCNRFDGNRCTDPLDGIKGYHDKETYNQTLDLRIMNLAGLDIEEEYTARQLLEKLKARRDIIFQVWLEEADELTQRRNELFQKGLNQLYRNQPPTEQIK